MSLMPRHIIGELDLTEWPFGIIRGSSDYGAPQNVAEVIDSMLQDGEIVSATRSGNRVMSHSVFIEEADMQALAEAEARLIAECDKQRNTWSIDPGDGYGAVTVFDIFRVQVAYVHDDNWEWAGYRRYDLTIPALPFGRSESEVVTEALTSAASPTTTTIADGTSATNWTGTSAITVSSGMLAQTVSTYDASGYGSEIVYMQASEWTYTPASPFSFAAEPYLSFDFEIPAQATLVMTAEAFADGASLIRVSQVNLSNGMIRATFICSDTSASVLRLRVTMKMVTAASSAPSTGTHRIDNVAKTNQAPNASSTGRESLRVVSVEGSARTQGSLAVEHDSSALGTVLVYSCPELSSGALGYQPALSPWRSGGTTVTADSTMVSGGRSGDGTLATSTKYNVPITSLPRGTYAVMARLGSGAASAASGQVSFKVATNSGGTLYGQQAIVSDTITVQGTSGSYGVFLLGMVTLPTRDVSRASTATVQIDSFAATGISSLRLDEVWLFYLGDDAALTWVEAGASQRLWLDAATLDSYEPTIWRGNLSDRADAIHAGADATPWGVLSFAPPSMNVFVVTSVAQNPAVRLRHFPRWHTHAKKVAS